MSIFCRFFNGKRFLFLIVIVFFSVAGAWSEPLLTTYPVGDPLVFVGAAGLIGTSYLLEAHKPKPDLASLSTANIPSFDRWYTTHRSEPLSLTSDATLAGTVLLPALLIPRVNRSDLLSAGVVYAEVLALSYGAKSFIKGLVVRYRPYAYGTGDRTALLTDPELEDSFPSGHVTVAFAAAVSTGYLFDLYNSNRAQRAAVWGASLGLASLTAVLRVWSGNHFVSDVVAAAAIGSVVGLVVPFLHSPGSMAASGLFPAVRSLTPTGFPVIEWDLRLP